MLQYRESAYWIAPLKRSVRVFDTRHVLSFVCEKVMSSISSWVMLSLFWNSGFYISMNFCVIISHVYGY